MVANLLTEPIVEIRSKFNLQTEITDLGNNIFKIRSLSPIKSGRKTVGIVEAEEDIGLGALYAKRNAFRLNILIGLSCITVVGPHLGVFNSNPTPTFITTPQEKIDPR